MKSYRIYFIILQSLFFVAVSTVRVFSQTEEERRALIIFQFAHGVTWENEKDISEYTIGVFSSELEFEKLKELSAHRKIKGKPVEVVRYTKHEDIKQNHIVYVTKKENACLGFVYKKLINKNILIISDRSKEPQYSVININKIGSAQPYLINPQIYKKQRLQFSTQLVRVGGTREMVSEIYARTNREHIEQQKELERKKIELEKKEKLLKELQMKLEEQEKLLIEQKIKIKELEELLKKK